LNGANEAPRPGWDVLGLRRALGVISVGSVCQFGPSRLTASPIKVPGAKFLPQANLAEGHSDISVRILPKHTQIELEGGDVLPVET